MYFTFLIGAVHKLRKTYKGKKGRNTGALRGGEGGRVEPYVRLQITIFNGNPYYFCIKIAKILIFLHVFSRFFLFKTGE